MWWNWAEISVAYSGPRSSTFHGLISDADGFVIPNMEIEDALEDKNDSLQADNSKLSLVEAIKEEDMHLGDRGTQPTQSKEHEHNSTGRKQRFKLKFKEANRQYIGSGRENKVDNLRELVGGKNIPLISLKGFSRGMA